MPFKAIVSTTAVLLSAAPILLTGAPARACTTDPGTGECAPAPVHYRIQGTDGTLSVQRSPRVGDPLRELREGDQVSVVCQTADGGADPYDGLTGHTWDRLADGGWVYDHYVTTPAQGDDGRSPGVPPCEAEARKTTPVDTDDGSKPFVALGDSYAAGTGTYQDDDPGNTGTCHRSTATYSWMYAKSYRLPSWVGDTRPVLSACNGATTHDITEHNGDRPSPQVTDREALGANTRLVTLTIGGNDVGFADILGKCLDGAFKTDAAVHDCWDGELKGADDKIAGAGLRNGLRNAYTAITSRAPKAHLVVLTYPDIFPAQVQEGCGDTLGYGTKISQADLDHVHRTWHGLNALITQVAKQAGAAVLDEEGAFAGHDVCTGADHRYANGLMQGRHDHNTASLRARDDESYHPTKAGYVREADDLAHFVSFTWGD
ncbi:GDSL-type esterase/lipase family protein [Actinoallomurus spadix]|uniref:SGNH hydrolase-type esterase domain-containing protein n=1 Tax=Actinoallomurus spadix TaxID=79912 RepID=A0ABP3H230_9ACTN|nr:GDSL-type esterase/lipase family protein [Actinoallomurus spadix]MCO5987918.1 GDSL-type esterase/lipase family protein [Actinoallomurus spadix]